MNRTQQPVLPRLAAGTIERALEVSPVVVLTGARQTGKSTLVRELDALAEHRYLTLDDLDIRAQAAEDPAGLLARGERLILDEVQRVPDLLVAIKRAVDKGPREPGRFVLTGSANLLLMQAVSESLAGRATYLNLWPLTRRERLGQGAAGAWDVLLDEPFGDWSAALDGTSTEDWETVAGLGGYPVPAYHLEDAEARALWHRGYVRTYLERDLQDLAAISSLTDYRSLMRAVALRVGGIENQSDIARDIGISQSSAHRWLNLLETSFQLVRLQPYSVNRTRRLVKSPRIHWSDTGLALHLAGGVPRGAHLENLVLTDLLAWRDSRLQPTQLLYWRTRSGEEVDFVIEQRDELVAVEVKATTRPGFGDTRHLRNFRDEYGDRVRGALLLHGGQYTEVLAEQVLAVPWWRVI